MREVQFSLLFVEKYPGWGRNFSIKEEIKLMNILFSNRINFLNNLFQDLQSQSENIPVVSTHWVIQCTINNARIAYNNFRCKLPI